MVWERFDARHPIFEAGLAVDRDLRPLEASGRVSFANLRAAGSVIGGYNRFADGAGSGVAAVTGLAAGHLAAAAVERRRSG
jgi:glycerol-3-phosphate dehydrogenase subunit B